MLIVKHRKSDQFKNVNFISPSKLFVSYNLFLLLKNDSKIPFNSWEEYISEYISSDKDGNKPYNITSYGLFFRISRATLIDEALGSALYTINTNILRSGIFRLCSRSKGSLYQGTIRICIQL